MDAHERHVEVYMLPCLDEQTDHEAQAQKVQGKQGPSIGKHCKGPRPQTPRHVGVGTSAAGMHKVWLMGTELPKGLGKALWRDEGWVCLQASQVDVWLAPKAGEEA